MDELQHDRKRNKMQEKEQNAEKGINCVKKNKMRKMG